MATEQRFSEPDERRAIARFREMTKPAPVMLPVATSIARPALGRAVLDARHGRGVCIGVKTDAELTVARAVQGSEIWTWLRDELTNRPEYIARMVGIPEVAGLRYLSIPKTGMKLSEIIGNYKIHGNATAKAKQEAVKPLERLMAHAGATTLDDLTTPKLLAFKSHVEKTVPGPATRRAYYARIKAVIRFGLKTGMDADRIRPALDRCAVLWTSEAMPSVNPQPISREHFQKLLVTGNGTWRAWLLVGLNLCLHMEEVCAMKWTDFDIPKGTYSCIRNKTRRKRIPRAATLWAETIDALKAIKQTENPYVFISSHGTRYNKNTRVNDFRDLRIKAGLPDAVTFDTIRDGSYTAAVNGAAERIARVLAGHRSAGLQDNYVLRNPDIVRPACDAVHRAYFRD